MLRHLYNRKMMARQILSAKTEEKAYCQWLIDDNTANEILTVSNFGRSTKLSRSFWSGAVLG